MKILQLHNYYQRKGGEDVVVANEKLILQEAGHSVDLLTAHSASISGLASKVNTVLHTAYNQSARLWLAEKLLALRPDVVHVHNTFPLLSPSVYDACADSNIPVIQTLHNFRIFCAAATLFRNGSICELCLDGNPFRAVVHRCYRGSVSGSLASAHMIWYHSKHKTWSTKVTRFIALTKFCRNKYIEAGLPAERIVVKPNFVVDPGPPDFDRDRFGALFVGRLVPEKGLAELLASWPANVPLRVLGDGPDRAILERMAPANVTFEGQVDAHRIRDAMQTAQVLVMPSIWQEPGIPIVVLEALANGLPFVAYKQGAFPELVDEGRAGLLVDPGTSFALGTVELMRDVDALERMSAEGRRLYERYYTPKHSLDQILSIYEDAIAETQTPSS